MAISKFEENVDIIAGLPTTPSPPDYTAETLKAAFDLGANKIKTYINERLIPGIEKELTDSALGGGVYQYLPSRRLLKSYTQPGTYTVDVESEWGSYNDLYEIVLVGAGGGGKQVLSGVSYSGSGGGGGGAVRRLDPMIIKGQAFVTVGTGGSAGQNGTNSTIIVNDSTYETANGGMTPLGAIKIGQAGGIGGTDGVYAASSELGYGAGGDACGYGIGAKGGILRDDIRNPQGYGGGGWGPVSGANGAVFIYGYRQN